MTSSSNRTSSPNPTISKKPISTEQGSPKTRYFFWLSMMVVFITVLSLSILGISLHFIHKNLLNKAGQGLAVLASSIATQLSSTMFERKSDISLVADRVRLKQTSPRDLTNYLTHLSEISQAYLSLSILTTDGQVIASSSPRLLNRDFSQEPVLTMMHKNHQLHFEDAKPLPDFDNTLALTIAAPILSTHGELQGLVLGQVGMPYVARIFQRATEAVGQQMESPSTFEWQLLNQDGTLLIDSELNQAGQVNLKDQGLPSALLSSDGNPGYVEEQHLRRQVPVITGYAATKGIHASGIIWNVLVRRDKEAVLAPIRDIESLLGLSAIVLVGPFIGFLFVTIRKLQKAHAETAQAIELVSVEKKRLSDLSNRLSLATESANLGIWEWTLANNLLIWDEHMYALYGIQDDNFSGTYDTWVQTIHPDDRDQVHEAIQMLLSGEQEFHAEYRVVWPDQTIH